MAESSLYLWNSPNSLSLISYSWAGVRPLTLNRCRSSAIRCSFRQSYTCRLAIMWSSLSDSDCASFRSQADDTAATAQSSSRVRSRYVGFSSFMVRAGRRRKASANMANVRLFTECQFSFSIFPICFMPQRHITNTNRNKETFRTPVRVPECKSPFAGSRYEKSPKYGTGRAKKRISGDRIAGDPNRRPPEGGAAQGCNPGP